MLHGSVNQVGPVMGGPNTILQTIMDILGPTGTIMMYVGWQEITDDIEDLSLEAQQRIIDHHPPFDPATARAVRKNSVLAEFLRTWPGTLRSLSPEASMAARGANAAHLIADHPLDYAYGAGSPLEKLVHLAGKVFLLGDLLENITLMHYSEAVAEMRDKVVIRYGCPILRGGQRVWVEIEDFETGEYHHDYTFSDIAGEYMATGRGRRGQVGDAPTILFDAASLHAFTRAWFETHFGETA